MRIMVYARRDGTTDVTVVPGRRAHLPPVSHTGKDREQVLAAVSETIKAVHAHRGITIA